MSLPPGFGVRPLAADDALAVLSAGPHRAAAPLAAAGLTFTAVGQTVAALTVLGVCGPQHLAWARATPWFYRDAVAHPPGWRWRAPRRARSSVAKRPVVMAKALGPAPVTGTDLQALAATVRRAAHDVIRPAPARLSR